MVIDCNTGCLLCYANLRGRTNYPRHRGYRRPRAETKRSNLVAISKRDQSRIESGERLCLEACSIMTRYSTLWEFFTETTFDDGSRRDTPSMTVFLDAGLLKACLNDKSQGLIAFCTGSSLTAILAAFDEGLAADTLDWRKAQTPPRKK